MSSVLVVAQLPPPVHGSNVMAERFMTALEQAGHEARIVEKLFSRSLDEVGRASFKKALMVPALYRSLEQAVDRVRPDCCVFFITVGITSLLVDCLLLHLLRRKGVPYLLYFHGRGFPRYESPRYLPVRGIVRRALRGALGGLVLGEGVKDDVKHLISDDRLFVLPNGIPPLDEAHGAAPRPRESEASVVFLSNLIPAKGPMRFLEMVKLVHEKEPAVRFSLAGRHVSIEYLETLQRFVADNGLSGCVNMPGAVYGADKEALLREADVLVFPTSNDTFPVVNLEAMQWGVPVITSPVGAIPEVIRDGVNGFIVEPGDIPGLAKRVLELVRDPALRRRMGEAGRELFERHYSLDGYRDNVDRALSFFLRAEMARKADAPRRRS